MCISRSVRLREQVRFLQRQFLQEGELQFNRCAFNESHFTGFGSCRGGLEGPNLYATGNTLGLPEPSPECRSFVSRGCRSSHCSSDFSRPN